MQTFKETEKYALYTKSGGGKTFQIGHLIEAFGADNVGIVSCEDGLGTIETLVTPENVKPCNDLNGLREAYKWATERYAGTDKWVAVDGGTRVLQWVANGQFGGADLMLETVLKGTKAMDLPADIKPFARYLTDKGVIDTQKIWIRIGRDCEILMDAWKRLPCNLVWTFWEEETSRGQYDKGLPWKPDAPGKAATAAIVNTFDWVIRLKREGGKAATALLDPTSIEYIAKHRIDPRKGIEIPAAIADFNLAKFHQRIKGTAAVVST